MSSKLRNRFKSKLPEEEFSLGGILGGAGTGAGTGAAIGSLFPGPGTIIGGIVGGVAGLAGGIAGHIGENREEAAQQAAYDEYQSEIKDDAYLAGVGGSENPYRPTFPMGGLLPYSNAEVEGEEVLQRPSGRLSKVIGKKHEQGGVDVNEPAGTRVYSDRVKFKETGRTFAEEADIIRKQIAKLDKQLA